MIYLDKQKKHTARSFGYKWKIFSVIDDHYKKNFLDEISPLDYRTFFKDKTVLDAGTGIGIPSYCIAENGAREVFAIDITGKRPNDIAGIVELKLIRGASEKFMVGDIAVVGSDIVGRILRIGLTRIELIPVTHKEVGLTRATIVPAHPTRNRSSLLADIIMQSNGDSVMLAEVLATSGVQIGDLVQLDDSSWPAVGIGYTLGVVVDVAQLDEAPLRHRVVIEPRRRARDLSKVVVFGTGEKKVE